MYLKLLRFFLLKLYIKIVMGCISFIFKLVFFQVVLLMSTVVFLIYGPNQLDIDPIAYKTKLVEKFDGPLEQNNLLDKGVFLFENDLIGPESLAVYKGNIYTGLHTGEIVKIIDDKTYKKVAQIGKPCEGQWDPKVCGRTLGIRATQNGQLYAVDAYYGLYSIDLQTGVKKSLLSMNQPVSGKPMKFPDDLDIDVKQGVVYLSDVSTKWSLDDIMYTILEHDDRGRIIKLDIKTGKSVVLMNGLHFPNGVQISGDGKALLVCEVLKERILKYHLEGPKKGSTEVFATLPGAPDNIRLNPRGGYWVGMAYARNASSPGLGDRFSEYPVVNLVAARFFHGLGSILNYLTTFYPNPVLKDFSYKIKKAWPLMTLGGNKAMTVELDKNGKILRSLQSDNQKYSLVSEVLEHKGHLYMGSFLNPYLIKVKL